MATIRTTYRLPTAGTHTANANLVLHTLAAAPERATAGPGDMRERIVTVRFTGTATAITIAHAGTGSYWATPKIIAAHGRARVASPYITNIDLGPAPWGLASDEAGLNHTLTARWLQDIAELLRLASVFAHYAACPGRPS